VVGAWNLEYLGSGTRGFPEYTRGGPSYPPRTLEQIDMLANVIRDRLDAKILMLSEINPQGTSPGLFALLEALGPTWKKAVSDSGGKQHTAIIFDTGFVERGEIREIEIPERRMNGDDVFARDPLVGRFVFLDGGVPANDIVVVALHLASGQDKVANHDEALRTLLTELDELRGSAVLPEDEWDIVIGGDLNLSLFDDHVEASEEELAGGGYEFLLQEPYPATRLAGVPLEPGSQIDYLIAQRAEPGRPGLLGEELPIPLVTVHQDLADGDWDGFRRDYSDHFPVTTCIGIVPDTDARIARVE